MRLHLAVHELDEKHIGTFSFRSEENIRKVSTALLPQACHLRYMYLNFKADWSLDIELSKDLTCFGNHD